MITAFREKYNYLLEYDSQPSGASLSLIAEKQEKRTIEFAPLSGAASAADGRRSIIEPVRLGKTSPFFADTSMLNVCVCVCVGWTSEFNETPGNFAHAVRILMYTYALASASDPPGNTWRSLDADRAHISSVARYSRLSTAAGGALGDRIADVEMALRSDRAEFRRKEPNLNLPDVITIVSRSNLWPLSSEFRGF